MSWNSEGKWTGWREPEPQGDIAVRARLNDGTPYLVARVPAKEAFAFAEQIAKTRVLLDGRGREEMLRSPLVQVVIGAATEPYIEIVFTTTD